MASLRASNPTRPSPLGRQQGPKRRFAQLTLNLKLLISPCLFVDWIVTWTKGYHAPIHIYRVRHAEEGLPPSAPARPLEIPSIFNCTDVSQLKKMGYSAVNITIDQSNHGHKYDVTPTLEACAIWINELQQVESLHRLADGSLFGWTYEFKESVPSRSKIERRYNLSRDLVKKHEAKQLQLVVESKSVRLDDGRGAYICSMCSRSYI